MSTHGSETERDSYKMNLEQHNPQNEKSPDSDIQPCHPGQMNLLVNGSEGLFGVDKRSSFEDNNDQQRQYKSG